MGIALPFVVIVVGLAVLLGIYASLSCCRRKRLENSTKGAECEQVHNLSPPRRADPLSVDTDHLEMRVDKNQAYRNWNIVA